MSVSFPEGAVDTLPADPTGDPIAADTGVSMVALAALASAYQLAQNRVSANAERGARQLWAAQRPINDQQLTAWMQSWNALLAGQASQQAALTTAYSRVMMSQFGVPLVPIRLTSIPDTATQWLNSPFGKAAPASLRGDVARAQEAATADRATIAQAAQLDRIAYLHSPVIKQRWHVSQGVTFDQGLADTGAFVDGATYDAGRAVERMVMGAHQWPAFKNGTAMLYQRVPQAGACGWCRVVATRMYSLASYKSGAAWHAHCRCQWMAVPFDQAKAYADVFARTKGDYYAAAGQIGTWSGPAPKNYRTVEREKATVTGTTAARKPPSTARTAVVPSVEPQAQALVDRANVLNAQARELVKAGDSAGANAIYQQAIQLTSQALRLRTAR